MLMHTCLYPLSWYNIDAMVTSSCMLVPFLIMLKLVYLVLCHL